MKPELPKIDRKRIEQRLQYANVKAVNWAYPGPKAYKQDVSCLLERLDAALEWIAELEKRLMVTVNCDPGASAIAELERILGKGKP